MEEENKEQSSLYGLLSILIILGVVAFIAWQAFFVVPPPDPVPEERVPEIKEDFFEDDTFRRLRYFDIIGAPDPEMTGRENPFYPFEEGVVEEEIIEEGVIEEGPEEEEMIEEEE